MQYFGIQSFPFSILPSIVPFSSTFINYSLLQRRTMEKRSTDSPKCCIWQKKNHNIDEKEKFCFHEFLCKQAKYCIIHHFYNSLHENKNSHFPTTKSLVIFEHFSGVLKYHSYRSVRLSRHLLTPEKNSCL